MDELNEVKKSYKEILFNNRKKDSISGRTLEGIHRSDLLVSERNKGVFASQCSTGEQKGLLLGLILTHLDLIAEKSLMITSFLCNFFGSSVIRELLSIL